MENVFVTLTQAQQRKIDGLMREADDAAAAGKPGMVVAQVFSDHMSVGFLDYDRAQKFAKRHEDGRPKTVSNAYEC